MAASTDGKVRHTVSDVSKKKAQSRLKKMVESSGLKILGNILPGRSGAEHTFNIVGQDSRDSRLAFAIVEKVDQAKLFEYFMKHLDTGAQIYLIHDGEVEKDVVKLAETYHIELMALRNIPDTLPHSRRMGVKDALSLGRNFLLEVDTSVAYEDVLRDIAVELLSNNHAVCVFSSRSSPVYKALLHIPEVRFYIMTRKVSYSTPATDQAREVLVPEGDEAVLLDVLDQCVKTNPHNLALLLDSISDLILSLGFERTYAFLKQANEMVDGNGMVSLFIIKRGAHDERIKSLIRSIFTGHLSYDESGLNTTR